MSENLIKKRSELAAEDTWATEDLFVSDEAWEESFATLAADSEKLASFAGHLAESAETLFAYLQTMEQVDVKCGFEKIREQIQNLE